MVSCELAQGKALNWLESQSVLLSKLVTTILCDCNFRHGAPLTDS